MAIKVLVSDIVDTHAAAMQAIIEAECPDAYVEIKYSDLDVAVTYAIANDFDIISRSTTGLDDDRNEDEGDTAWEGDTVDGGFSSGFSSGFEKEKVVKVGIVHAFGNDGTAEEIDDPSRLDVICSVAKEGGDYGAGLEILTDDSTTSSAVARVAGVIAQIMTNNPSWNFHDARQAIRQTCDNYSTGWVAATGYGVMDKTAAKAVTSLDQMSPTRISGTNDGNAITVSWTNPKNTDWASTLIALFDSDPDRDAEPTGFYDSTGTSSSHTFYGKAGTYYLAFMAKDSSGNYSPIESFDLVELTLEDSWSSVQEDVISYLKTLIGNIQRNESGVFGYVDYLTEENVNKIGKRFPAVLIEDGDETWEQAGNSRYDAVSYTHLTLPTN